MFFLGSLDNVEGSMKGNSEKGFGREDVRTDSHTKVWDSGARFDGRCIEGRT